ncbi:MAG TPA: DUF1499 domain-containing protein [Caldimonas sp.]
MLIAKSILVVLVLVALVAVAAGQAGLLGGRAPTDLGVHDGRLKPPSTTPNSVSSQADLYPDHSQRQYASLPPLPVKGSGPATMAKIKDIVESLDGAEIVRSEPDYLYAQFTTRIMKFVDDTEFWFDPVANVIQVRSASRLGSKDFGVNRARIETVRHRLAAL